MTRLPAVSLAAVPGRRAKTVEVAQVLEEKGFPGIYGPSLGDSLSLCNAIALSTKSIEIGTSITPIYTRNVMDFAQTPRVGDMPPIILATLRKKMIQLAEEVGDGMVFANGARSHMGDSLSVLTDESRQNGGFFIGNMIPTCISDDKEAAAAVNRKTLTSYAFLPNYRNYWKEAGYEQEMTDVEDALQKQDLDRVPECLSDKWLADTTLFGSATEVRDGIEAWFDSGIKTPIIVPSSASGGQMQAIDEFLALWD